MGKLKPVARIDARELVDELGKIKAKIAPLTEREKEIKATLAKLSGGTNAVFEGSLFSAPVVWWEKGTVDMAAVRKKLGPKWMRDHTSYEQTVTVRCNSRKRAGGAGAEAVQAARKRRARR